MVRKPRTLISQGLLLSNSVKTAFQNTSVLLGKTATFLCFVMLAIIVVVLRNSLKSDEGRDPDAPGGVLTHILTYAFYKRMRFV